MTRPTHHARPVSRRDFLLRSGAGFGGLALAGLMARGPSASEPAVTRNPMAARKV